MRGRQGEKRKFSIIFRDPTEVHHRKCITSIIAPEPTCMGANANELRAQKQSVLFTASRDRLIKLWSVSFGSKQPRLLTNFDGHMDWVNQIKLIEEANTLVSCSNDTTVRVWRLKQLDEYMHGQPKKDKHGRLIPCEQGPFSNLCDHTDYVRTIDYSRHRGSLFSAADDGTLAMWDLNAEKLLQKYNYADQGVVRVDREESKEEQKDPVVIPDEYPVVSN